MIKKKNWEIYLKVYFVEIIEIVNINGFNDKILW